MSEVVLVLVFLGGVGEDDADGVADRRGFQCDCGDEAGVTMAVEGPACWGEVACSFLRRASLRALSFKAR